MANPLKRISSEMQILLKSNKIRLCYCNLPTVENRVNLNYFHPEYPKGVKAAEDSGERNLGDGMSPVIVEHMLSQKGLSLDTEVCQTSHLFAVGSILFMGHQDATVWGSGLLLEPSKIRGFLHGKHFRKLDVRAVRGPYTRQILQKIGHRCPEVYGDPGCLLPMLYQPETEKSLDYLIIPHVSMEKEVRKYVPEENIVSMATEDYRHVAEKICSAKKVIASSLHGIIFAEAYGVPAIFYQDRPERYNYKYADWYEGSGRKSWQVATGLEQAIAMDPDPAPDLSNMQQGLIEAFPYDLWK